MREVATISMLILANGDPGVKMSAGSDFMDVTPLERISLLMAAAKLCGAAMVAICEDNPNDKIDLEEILNFLTIIPSNQSVN